jgi:phosphatidylglycerophosphate synthase
LPPSATAATAIEVEEPADRLIHRPLARPLVRVLAATPLTPNHVTLLSGASGIVSAIVIAASSTRPTLRLIAAALLLLAAVLDCADGQLARLRGSSSPGGGALDGIVDEAVGFAVIAAVTYLASQQNGTSAWLLGAFALISSVVQCLLFDAAKEAYLSRFGVAHAASKIAMVDRARSDSHSWLEGIFDSYVQRIRWLARHLLGDAAGDRRGARRRIRLWATLGLGTHMAYGYSAVAISIFWPPALYGCLLIFSTAMNAQLAVLIVWERSARVRSA